MLTEKRLTPLTFSIDIQGYSMLEVSHACLYLIVCVRARARVRACVSVTGNMCRNIHLLMSMKQKCLLTTIGLVSRMV